MVNSIFTGEKVVTISSMEYNYKGDLDSEGRACGFGEAVKTNSYDAFRGTFFNDRPHGLRKLSVHFNLRLKLSL